MPAQEALVIDLQGELADRKSDSTLYPTADRSSPLTERNDASRMVLNTIGGDSTWGKNRQWLEWDFHAEKAGYYRLVMRVRPVSYTHLQCSSWSLGWVGAATASFFEQSDYLAGDFYQGGVEQSVICKYLNNVTVHKPIEFMVSRCSTLEEHTTTKPMPLLAAQRYSACLLYTSRCV